MRAPASTHTRPIWAEISASRLIHNFRTLKAAGGEAVDLLAVIKADAYGHGAAECAPVLAGAGAGWLGVTSVEEGVLVRSSLGILPQGMEPRILVMCGLWPGEEEACLSRRLTPVVWEYYHLELLDREARRRRMGPRTLAVHLEIDTGMARQGVAPGPLLEEILAQFTPDSPLLLEGVMTHLASTECALDPQNAQQMDRFDEALRQVRAAGLTPAIVHAGNTSSTDSGLIAHALPPLAQEIGARALTRAGLGLYGYALPLSGAQPHAVPGLKPALTWKTRVVSLRDVPAGATVGYNGAFVTPQAMRLALLPVGYADGLRRALSSTAEQPGGAALLRGQRAPIIGRVSMDLTIVDVSGIPGVQIGEEAVLIGAQQDESGHSCAIGADEQARLSGTSAYEILCGISDRVPRVVVE